MIAIERLLVYASCGRTGSVAAFTIEQARGQSALRAGPLWAGAAVMFTSSQGRGDTWYLWDER
jgi:hypothetical protein